MTTAAGSNPLPGLVYDPSNKDYYKPTSFPEGTWSGKVSKISDPELAKKYGDADGNWITTDANTTVESFKKLPDGTFVPNNPPTRKDWGYYYHGNSNFGDSTSHQAPSLGCVTGNQKSNTQINRNVLRDKNKIIFTAR